MRNNFFIETVMGVALAALLMMLLNPFDWWMPTAMAMTLTGVLVAVFAVFASFMWREKPRDEREGLHRLLAGRWAFLAGSGVLVLGIVAGEFAHDLDPWLPLALGAMILAKIAGIAYGRIKL